MDVKSPNGPFKSHVVVVITVIGHFLRLLIYSFNFNTYNVYVLSPFVIRNNFQF